MGYHFSIHSFSFPGLASPGDQLSMILNLENTGVAPIYHRLLLKIRFIGNGHEHIFETDADIRNWMHGTHEEQLSASLPQEMLPGEYTIEIGISNEYIPMIYFATDAPRNGGYYQVGQIKIQ